MADRPLERALRDRGVFRFGIAMRTPFAGQPVVMRVVSDGAELFTLEEWGTLGPARIRIDEKGSLLFHGRPTGYRIEDLIDTGQTVDP